MLSSWIFFLCSFVTILIDWIIISLYHPDIIKVSSPKPSVSIISLYLIFSMLAFKTSIIGNPNCIKVRNYVLLTKLEKYQVFRTYNWTGATLLFGKNVSVIIKCFSRGNLITFSPNLTVNIINITQNYSRNMFWGIFCLVINNRPMDKSFFWE